MSDTAALAADPVALTAALVRCPSVTPEEGGALDLLEDLLTAHGFACTRIERGGIDNLYARWGTRAPVFGFAGHTDVVPVGRPEAWSVDPFGAERLDGVLYGRGACDMKSGVAAMVAASVAFVRQDPPEGSIALLVTGDEEGDARDGTAAILDWMEDTGEQLDFCIVGEPTSTAFTGDTVKIGRRGSMTGTLTVAGRQGHTAYPDRAINPLPVLARICARLAATPIDLGSTHFQATTLALTTIDVGNPANNVIPAEGSAVFNVRFGDLQTPESVRVWVDEQVAAELKGTGCEAAVTWQVSGVAFLTPPGPLTDIVSEAIAERTMERPALTTGGGTSDARFIRAHCPVVEFGLVGDTMHQTDECVAEADIELLAALYGDILRRFFGT